MQDLENTHLLCFEASQLSLQLTLLHSIALPHGKDGALWKLHGSKTI